MKIDDMPIVSIKDPLNNDDVRYHWHHISGKFGYEHIARCYASVMTSSWSKKFLEDYSLTLIQRHPNGFSKDIYFEWIDLCKEYNIINKGMNHFYNDGMVLDIPHGYNQHQMFTAMVCFRLIDAWRIIPWMVIQYHKKHNVNFWQALHYAFTQSLCSGHNFMEISKNLYTHTQESEAILADSIAMRYFFSSVVGNEAKLNKLQDLVYPNRHRSENKFSRIFTTNILQYISVDLNKASNIKCKVEDLLNPKWEPLYKLDNPTAESVSKLYHSICAA